MTMKLAFYFCLFSVIFGLYISNAIHMDSLEINIHIYDNPPKIKDIRIDNGPLNDNNTYSDDHLSNFNAIDINDRVLRGRNKYIDDSPFNDDNINDIENSPLEENKIDDIEKASNDNTIIMDELPAGNNNDVDDKLSEGNSIDIDDSPLKKSNIDIDNGPEIEKNVLTPSTDFTNAGRSILKQPHPRKIKLNKIMKKQNPYGDDDSSSDTSLKYNGNERGFLNKNIFHEHHYSSNENQDIDSTTIGSKSTSLVTPVTRKERLVHPQYKKYHQRKKKTNTKKPKQQKVGAALLSNYKDDNDGEMDGEDDRNYEATCSYVKLKERVECGWSGITKTVCLSRGCCFDNTKVGEGFKWCFNKIDQKYSVPVKGCILKYNDKKFVNGTMEECKEKCTVATSFDCQSMEYQKSTKTCWLSKETTHTKADSYEIPCTAPFDDVTYLEKINDSGYDNYNDNDVNNGKRNKDNGNINNDYSNDKLNAGNSVEII